MDWGTVLTGLAEQGAVTLASAFGGPLAGQAVQFIGDKLLGKKDATPEEVKQALQGLSGDQIVQLRKLDNDFKLELAKAGITLQVAQLEADTNRQVAVNATMQSEAKSDHWPTYTWRPFLGFQFGLMTTAIYFVLPYLNVNVPSVPETVWMAYLAILGAASYYRGKMQADPNVPTDNRG
jgi:hypothetical protein